MAYLNVTEVESAIEALSRAYPGQCELITLPNATHEGRISHAIRIGLGRLDNRPSMLFIGGQHAREWGSCEICINLAADLLEAYDLGTGLTYGGKSFTAAQVRQVVEQSQVFIFPCVNPDGRNYSQTGTSATATMWRKNRNPVAGVDVNRNYDFLWDFRTAFSPAADLSRISDNPASNTYHGPAPASEPETRNVVWLFDTYPQIRWSVDIHSFSQLLYHNWGDDENQTTDPSMNFLNPAHNGTRGVEGDAYREYIRPSDLAAERCLVQRMQSALRAVRGVNYTTGQSFELYPTSGTATDYPYSRHYADPTKTKTLGFLIEWGTEFQPWWAEMENIILDVSSALLEFALAAPCECDVGLPFRNIDKQGFGARTIRPRYPGLVCGGTPLLHKFYFLFSGSSVDHHINQVMIQPDGRIQDLAPNADPSFANGNPDRGNITLSYQDKAGNDRYFFNVGHTLVNNLQRFRMRDVGCRGSCTRRLPEPPAPNVRFALIGFQLAFTGGRDHHIDEIAISESNRVLRVAFNDKNDDDVFAYAVDFAWVPSPMILSVGNESGFARGGVRIPLLEPSGIPLGQNVLSGFSVDFTSKDHHVRDVGVLLFADRLELFYGDRNFDDRFRWEVSWLTLVPELEVFDPT